MSKEQYGDMREGDGNVGSWKIHPEFLSLGIQSPNVRWWARGVYCNHLQKARYSGSITCWWFQPIWKILVKLDHETPGRGENEKCLSCHHPDYHSQFRVSLIGSLGFLWAQVATRQCLRPTMKCAIHRPWWPWRRNQLMAICAMVKSRYIGDGHPTFNRESL